MNKVLTIIIPTYNMEDYLRYCLDSLLIKDHFEQLEVLVVNDGSKDGSSAIAHEYEQSYPEVFRVIDKENGNYGSCVNRGLKEACGKYVKVLDADDSFDTANFEAFVAFLMDTDADLILSDFAVVNPQREIKKIIKYRFGEEKIFDFKSICNNHAFMYMQMHAVTYRRENLLKLGYKQTEGISYTDQQWIFLPMITVKTVACFEPYVYKYLVGREGQTINIKNNELKVKEQLARCVADNVKAYESHKDEILWSEVREYLYWRMMLFINDIYLYTLCHYGEETKKRLVKFDEELKMLSQEVYELSGSNKVCSIMGFRYIDYWRKHQNVRPWAVRILRDFYLASIRLKEALRKSDDMNVPESD